MGGMIHWQGQTVPFQAGETIASALARAGISRLGVSGAGQDRGVFCGIGQCQSCLVLLEGRAVEACLTPCRNGMQPQPQQGGHTDG